MKLLSGLAVVSLAATTLAPTGAAAAPVPPTQLVTDWIAGELTRRARSALGSKRLRVVAFQNARGADSVSTTFWLRRK